MRAASLWPLAAMPLCLLAACGGDASRPAHARTHTAPPPPVTPVPPPRPPPVAKPAPEPRFSRADLRRLERRMAAPWRRAQADSGTFEDYTDTSPVVPDTRYGDAFMGYALVRVGLRTDSRRLVRAGLRGVAYSVDHWFEGRKRITQSVFENWAVAATYNLARRRLAHDRFFRAQRPLWEEWLRISRAERSGIASAFGNHWLVDALGVFETLRSGVRSTRSDAVAGGSRAPAARGALSLVNTRAPALAPPGHTPFVLDDPPDNPMAYQGLTLGLYARLVDTLGERASRRARNLLRRATYALWYDTAPDGDSGYFGRSQEMVWSPASTAYGALVAANARGTRRSDAARFRALADRSFERLRDAYPIAKRGQHYVPGLARNVRRTIPWLDGYAGGPSMDGIALLMVDLAIDEVEGGARRARIGSDRALSGVLGTGSGQFAIVRRGPVWFALRLRSAAQSYHAGDLRYDAGLAVAKRRGDGGHWRDVVPVRPKTRVPGFDSAGPDLLSGSAVVGVPVGDRLETSTGAARVSGAIRDRAGAELAPYRASYVARGCGVELRFAAYPGSVYEYSAFFRGRERPEQDGGRLAGGGQRVVASPEPSSVRLERGYGSAVDPRLVRARMRFSVPRARTVRIRMC